MPKWIVHSKTRSIKEWILISYWFQLQNQALMTWGANKQRDMTQWLEKHSFDTVVHSPTNKKKKHRGECTNVFFLPLALSCSLSFSVCLNDIDSTCAVLLTSPLLNISAAVWACREDGRGFLVPHLHYSSAAHWVMCSTHKHTQLWMQCHSFNPTQAVLF